MGPKSPQGQEPSQPSESSAQPINQSAVPATAQKLFQQQAPVPGSSQQLVTRWWPTNDDPGYTLALVGLILDLLAGPLISTIPLFMARNKSKEAGFNNKLVNILIIINIAILVLFTISIIVVIALMASSN